MTRVKFLISIEGDTEDLYAFFPDEVSDAKGNLTAYSHVGQHSGCCIEYALQSTEATKTEYTDLLQELESIGYDDLLILNEDK
tara:strand:+ start:237 stop:485 length:249 start_codon:yes stop_codon:yes gene_type:complete